MNLDKSGVPQTPDGLRYSFAAYAKFCRDLIMGGYKLVCRKSIQTFQQHTTQSLFDQVMPIVCGGLHHLDDQHLDVA